MASDMPLPIPPRTPTPPPDDDNAPVGLGLDEHLSPMKMGFDANTLSPLSATFPPERGAILAPSHSLSQRVAPSSLYSPASPYTPPSATSDTETPSLHGAENARGPFNFQSVSYMPGKPQVAKNARSSPWLWSAFAKLRRISVAVADTNTSIAACRTRYSWSHPRAPRSSSPHPFLCPRSKNTGRVCQTTRCFG